MRIFSLLFGIVLFQRISCQCTFPATLTGTWVSSNDGTWDINSTHLLNYYTLSSTTGMTIAAGVNQLDFSCFENQGDTKYVIKSEEFLLLGGQRSVYTCIDIRELSSNKLLYYHATEADPSGLQFTIQSTYTSVCNLASYEHPYNYHIALKSGSETTALQNCPSTMFGSYNYDTCTDVNSGGTSLDVCDSRQQLIFNYTLCNTPQLYTLEGVLDCVHHIDSGSISYLTLYNRDSTPPDNNNYFQYVCLAVELSGSTVYVTARPNRCNDNQNATAIGSPGQALQLTSYYLCPITTDEPSSFNIVPIIIGVVVAILLLVLIGLIIYCCCRHKCRKKKPDEEEAKSDSESEDEEKKSESLSESRRSSKSSLSEDEEKKSIDSGISEPPVTGRTDSNIGDTGDTKDQEKELVITAAGDKEIEDKNSRPCSGQRSRMSDLPTSTIAPDEDQPLSHRSEEDQLDDDNKVDQFENEDQPSTVEEKTDDKENESEKEDNETVSEKADELDLEPESTKQLRESSDENVKREHQEDEAEADEESDSEQPEKIQEADAVTESETEEMQEKSEQDGESLHDEKHDREEMSQEEYGDKENEQGEEEDEKSQGKEEEGDDDDEEEEEDDDKEEEKEDEEEQQQQEQVGEETEADAATERAPENQEDTDENVQENKDDQHHSDLEIAVENKDDQEPGTPEGADSKPEDHEQTNEDEEQEHEEESDAEQKDVAAGRDKHLSSDEDEVQRKLVGGKKGKEYLAKGVLTTVLISREEEERKRQKLNNKTKSQKMRKMAKKKTRRFGGKIDRNTKYKVDDEYGSSDDEVRRRGLREAPFMKQYEDKKHIEHILDEQHYWSDPEADKYGFRLDDDMSNIFRSESSESEEEIIGIDTEGKPIRVKKTKRDKRKKNGDEDDLSNTGSDYLRQKMLKRAGSVDSMVSVEDPDNIDHRKSKRRLNEHIIRADSDEEMTAQKNKLTAGASNENEGVGDDRKKSLVENEKPGVSENTKLPSSKTRTITVKEHPEKAYGSSYSDHYRTINRKGALDGKENSIFSDFSDTDIDKLSDRDSGMDDEDGDVDVFLTSDQQQMIVNILFDEEMNLRPQFSRDENGRIIRRLDNTVIYDPHTGRFTYRKRLGQIFKVPRLKRNDKGRPLGGYIDDDFGPTETATVRRKSSSARRTQSGKSGHLSVDTRSPSADMKRARSDGKNVGFSFPDEDADSLPADQLEYNKRGRRDIGSAIRRTLNKRLFRKKRKLGGEMGSTGMLPDIRIKNAWGDDQHFLSGTNSAGGAGGVSPLHTRSGRFAAQSSPWSQRRTPGTGDAEQWQIYREGLQSDRRILENLQDKFNARDGPFATKEAFVESGEEAEQREGHYDRGFSYLTDDGMRERGIRERGCPELKKAPFFTIVRRPGDLESQEQLAEVPAPERRTCSAPLHVQDYHEEHAENGPGDRQKYTSDDSLTARSRDSRYSQMTSIDDNRLRRLLEELYRDKKYFDNYIESKDPKSDEFEHSQGLAEHGRGFLLRRADYWERRGPLPPRPPMTAIGWRIQRQQTLLASRQASELGISTATCTPDLSATNMPGAVESPRNVSMVDENDSRNTPNESYA